MKELRPLRSPRLCALGVPHGITTRTALLPAEGDVSFVTAPDVASSNREAWWQAIGVPLSRTVCAQQVHGCQVACVDESDVGRGAWRFDDALPETDGLVVGIPHVPVAVFCADCLPVLLYAPQQRVAAAIHAGWRGTTQGVVGHAIERMVVRYTVRPAELVAVLGPAIGACCYVVGEDVVTAWCTLGVSHWQSALHRRNGQWYFDLWQANTLILQEYGIGAQNIERIGGCTACSPNQWFSHRNPQGHEGRFAAVIMVPA